MRSAPHNLTFTMLSAAALNNGSCHAPNAVLSTGYDDLIYCSEAIYEVGFIMLILQMRKLSSMDEISCSREESQSVK